MSQFLTDHFLYNMQYKSKLFQFQRNYTIIIAVNFHFMIKSVVFVRTYLRWIQEMSAISRGSLQLSDQSQTDQTQRKCYDEMEAVEPTLCALAGWSMRYGHQYSLRAKSESYLPVKL